MGSFSRDYMQRGVAPQLDYDLDEDYAERLPDLGVEVLPRPKKWKRSKRRKPSMWARFKFWCWRMKNGR